VVKRSVILSGAGPYSDPWHAFPETSHRLSAIIRGLGHEVEVTEDIPGRLGDLGGVDVLVVNAAAGPSGAGRESAQRGLHRFMAAGGGILGVHVGVCSLLDLSGWSAITGCAWMDGRSTHPPLGPSRVEVFPHAHPIGRGISGFELIDERYTDLDIADGSTVVAAHRIDGTLHPLLWARTVGGARVVSDALGHGAESYDSDVHRQLIARSVDWLGGGTGRQ
jgi:type 1 glutamine amidotransferase